MKNAFNVRIYRKMRPSSERVAGYNDVRNGLPFPREYDMSWTPIQQRNYERGRQQCSIVVGVLGLPANMLPEFKSTEMFGQYLKKYFGETFTSRTIRPDLNDYEKLFAAA